MLTGYLLGLVPDSAVVWTKAQKGLFSVMHSNQNGHGSQNELTVPPVKRPYYSIVMNGANSDGDFSVFRARSVVKLLGAVLCRHYSS